MPNTSIRIITIEREYGSGAAGIAGSLARQLGWELWDQRLTHEIARLAKCTEAEVKRHEERRDPLYYRLAKSFALGSYEGGPGPPLEILDAESIVSVSKLVVEQAAAEGNCVIVGRGSQHFLRRRSDTLRFFLYASREDKIKRLIAEGTPASSAGMRVGTVDHERAAFIRKYFHAKWPDRSLYHAMINTGIGDGTVIRAILSFVRSVTDTQC